MTIFIQQAKKPFWTIRSPKDVTENPLGYYCAPNAADASYAGARTIEDFLAYGFIECWLSPDNFASWDYLERDDIQWLREYFLRTVEDTLLYFYKGKYEIEEGKPFTDFESDHDNSLTVDDSDEDDNELCLEWVPRMIGTDGCIAFDLLCSGGDTTTIFLDKVAYQNMSRVRSAIAMARQVNNLKIAESEAGLYNESAETALWWEELGVPNYKIDPNIKTCDDFDKWWRATQFANYVGKLMSE